jgi:hypothetical protein
MMFGPFSPHFLSRQCKRTPFKELVRFKRTQRKIFLVNVCRFDLNLRVIYQERVEGTIKSRLQIQKVSFAHRHSKSGLDGATSMPKNLEIEGRIDCRWKEINPLTSQVVTNSIGGPFISTTHCCDDQILMLACDSI